MIKAYWIKMAAGEQERQVVGSIAQDDFNKM
jgi:hypothetical protein